MEKESANSQMEGIMKAIEKKESSLGKELLQTRMVLYTMGNLMTINP